MKNNNNNYKFKKINLNLILIKFLQEKGYYLVIANVVDKYLISKCKNNHNKLFFPMLDNYMNTDIILIIDKYNKKIDSFI